MQTPAERHLIRRLSEYLLERCNAGNPAEILNIGAGRSTAIESRLNDLGCSFICDRIDVEDCAVEFPSVRDAWQCFVEEMTPLESGRYAVAFANYVLEHVADIERAASEIFRVLRPGGLFVTSVPNLTAPEFVIARYAPAKLQKVMTDGKGFRTCYAWTTVDHLTGLFEARGFIVEEVRYWAFTEGYLWRYPVLNLLSRLYDRIASRIGIKRCLGNACITLKKPFWE